MVVVGQGRAGQGRAGRGEWRSGEWQNRGKSGVGSSEGLMED